MALSSITTLGTIATPFANFVAFAPPSPAPDDAWYPPIKMLDRQGVTQLNRDRTNTIERHGIGTLERH